MSKELKAKRATQARLRRHKQKQRLIFLEQQAMEDDATADVKAKFRDALEKRKLLLDYDKNV